jgi:hypothetical protein
VIHIHNFIDKIKFFESKNSKDFIIPLNEAKNLHRDITKLLSTIYALQNQDDTDTQTNTEISGGEW